MAATSSAPPPPPDSSLVPGAGGLGPASAALEAELKRRIKQKGLVFWLDADAAYTDFVGVLAERAASKAFPYPVVRFQGSFLQLMFDLEGLGNDLYPDKVLVHMPGFTELSIAETPVYELYKAGVRHRKALDTLIQEAATGLVRPDDIQAFLAQGAPTLARADAWLSQSNRGELDVFLIGLEARTPEAVALELFVQPSKLMAELEVEGRIGQLLDYWHRSLGLDPAHWLALLFARSGDAASTLNRSEVPYFVVSWLMAVEFVTDLREPPVMAGLQGISKLPKPIVSVCRRLIEALREQFSSEYAQLSVEFEERLVDERTSHQPESLGSIDTFRFEESAVRQGALAALLAADWELALGFSRERRAESCFWVKQDPHRAHTWQLIRLAADAGRAIDEDKRGLRGCGSLEEATDRYRNHLFRVDRAHRLYEQLFHKLHSTDLEDEPQLRSARDEVRRHYRAWADRLCGEFAELCEEHGALPSTDLRQRAVYEQFVQPAIESGERVAFFMVDAMRFEMAEELRQIFAGKKFRTELHARLAELPTVTEVGMNALAPVSQQGKLRPLVAQRNFGGFRMGEKFTVHDPATRVQAMQERSLAGKAIDLELTALGGLSQEDLDRKLRTKNGSPLIVVRSLELDSAGERGFHLDMFESTLVRLREAVQRLHQAGISRFVLASDHGFLLQDPSIEQIAYKDSPKRRHVLSTQRSGMPSALELPLSALDYDVEGQHYLVFRKDTAVWKTQEKIAPFVHGGNSLQERVIPVLCLEKHSKAGASASTYEVVASALPAEGGRQRLSLQVRLQKLSTGLLSFAGPKRISLALRVAGDDSVVPQIVEVTPPGVLESGMLQVPPAAGAATVTFVLEGNTDEKVRIEIYHPDGTEQVTPKLVEGWFELRRNRRVSKPPVTGEEVASPDESVRVAAGVEVPPASRRGAPGSDWREAFDDAEFLAVFELVETQESVNEQELHSVLKSARRVRAFARRFDDLRRLVPFEVQITTIGQMKCYVKGDKR